ncbi:MAG: hypothetical protein AAB588_05940 [Patescibacteria group bacterium]
MPSEHSNQYDAARLYGVLADREASARDVIELLVEQILPGLNIRVLERNERSFRIQAMDRHLQELHRKYAEILNEVGRDDIAQRLGNLKGGIEVTSICEQLKGTPTEIRTIRCKLAGARDATTPEFLARLGFLPAQDFSRDDLVGDDALFEQLKVPEADSANRLQVLYATPLAELFPNWISTDQLSYPDKIIGDIPPSKMVRLFQFQRLHLWMNEVTRSMDDCIGGAFDFLQESFKKSAPTGPAAQAYEQIGDLRPLSFTALLEMAVNKKRDLRHRLEAVRLLEWATLLFSVKRNPVFLKQQEVQRSIVELLKIHTWKETNLFVTLKLDQKLADAVEYDETGRTTDENGMGRTPLTGRRLKGPLKELFTQYSDILDPKYKDKVIFDSNDKGAESSVLKIFILQELFRRCIACLHDQDTGLKKGKARKKIKALKRRSNELGRSSADFRLKPVGFEALDDNTRFSMTVHLSKRLDEYDAEERLRVSAFFSDCGQELATQLGLQNVRFEDYLWEPENHRGNDKSSDKYRIYKVHGDVSVSTLDYHDGMLQPVNRLVPVEIQFHPLESHLRLFFSGPTGVESYDARKIRALADRLHPDSLGGQDVYNVSFSEEVAPDVEPS